jgi:hypothetical protein
MDNIINPINSEKEDCIRKLVEDEIAKLKDKELKDIQSKISEVISKAMNGETWICLIEYQPTKLQWY